jgi:NAD(P)-dependent dehydrogenase (short-subunit alcohol dehydrogenase family)
MAEKFPEIVVITGASGGIGRATCRLFARKGAAVALLARSDDGLEAARKEIEEMGGRALVVHCDVADPEQVERAAQRVEQELGPIDTWVNNAMVTVISPAVEMAPEEYQRVTDVTYLGSVYGTLAALKYMRARNRGTIIQVGSALAYRGIPLQSAYCAAKFAIRGFLDSLRVELMREKSRIHVTMVQLSAFNTPQFSWARHRLDNRPQPLPPIFQPEEAARAIVWSATHRRRELYVGFPSFKTIVANKLMPGIADRIASMQAFDGQEDNSAPAPSAERQDNLFDPMPGDYGAHGRFDSRSKNHSLQLTLSMHREKIMLGVAAIILTFGAIAWARREPAHEPARTLHRLHRRFDHLQHRLEKRLSR